MASEPIKLAITIGDPIGIGPEVVLKALGGINWPQVAEVMIVGNRWLLQRTYHQLSQVVESSQVANPDHFQILDIPFDPAEICPDQGTAVSGAASFAYLEAAINLALAGEVQGIVTGPIAKSAWKLAGQNYAGQTELLAERSQCEHYGMLFVAQSPHTGWPLRTLLATTHIPLQQVPSVLTPALMTCKLNLLIHCLKQDFGLSQPRIAIAGLNPHSGEQGQLGTEEQDWLIPWIQEMRHQFPTVTLQGPVPPDTLWVEAGKAWFGSGSKGAGTRQIADQGQLAYDAYLALYHDQGLIPVKLLAFDRAVNTSIGLPFIRTSPDHGTAFDIAGRGIADGTSMKAAIELAIDLVGRACADRTESAKISLT